MSRWLALIAILVVLPSCAAIRRGAATEKYCEEHSKDHVYTKALSQMRSQIMADIAMHRPIEMPRSGGQQGFSSKTSFKIDENSESQADDDQHFVMKGTDAVYETIAVTAETSRVQITKIGTTTRMPDREWLLLKRIEPETASKLVAEADQHIDADGNPKN